MHQSIKIGLLFVLTSMISCSNSSIETQAQIKTDYTIQSKLIPYLQKNGLFRYVDDNLHTAIDKEFAYATKFASNGLAFVYDKDNRQAIIDQKGNIIRAYSDKRYGFEILEGLTLLQESKEYEKTLPIWKWEWNIMGSEIDKSASFEEIEISVLETGQKIESKTTNEDEHEEGIDTDISKIDNRYFVMNNKLYEVKGEKINKIADGIYFTFMNEKIVVTENNGNAVFNSIQGKLKKEKELRPLSSFTVLANGSSILIDSLNLTRYIQRPANSRVLQDIKTNEIYMYPNFDKPFPINFAKLSSEDIKFLKGISLIASVPNTPYFILGNFDYDSWKYNYRYINQKGSFLSNIDIKDFYLTTEIGKIIWPSSNTIIPQDNIEAGYQVSYINRLYEDDNLFSISITKGDERSKKGIWNRKTQQWIIPAEYYNIEELNGDKHIYAVQQKYEGEFMLYDAFRNKYISEKSYRSIESTGLVRKKILNISKDEYFYIDILTGKEYRE